MVELLCYLILMVPLTCLASSNMCGAEQCVKGSNAYGYSCCCSPGTCLENQFDTIVELEPGLWTMNTRNDPSAANSGPPHNRAVIFKVPASQDRKQGAFLVMVNGVGICNGSHAELRELEARENASLRHVVTPGDWHHVYLKDYNTAFPDATIHVPPGRILPLEPELKYKLMDIESPLAFLRPHLQIYLMKGLGQPFEWSTPRYEFFFFHPATRTLFAGDIMWYFSCEPEWKMRIAMPGVGKGKISFWDAAGSTMFHNKSAGAESAHLMLNLDFDRFVSAHGELGAQVPPGSHPSAKDLVKVALTTGRGPLSWFAETIV